MPPFNKFYTELIHVLIIKRLQIKAIRDTFVFILLLVAKKS
ncbi:hypothetical protein HMPREF0492_0408 [Lactobacillus acidophilus ATCC 4796]|nr:hypothetical protein LA14_1630 [Lactobacillus acidophilus La-14]EEJ76781.1 hypothetical protein HMPREF0492_0408 [Lactobacillus acidophilus ATCC 4796]